MLNKIEVDTLINDIQFEIDLADSHVISVDNRRDADKLSKWLDAIRADNALEIGTNNDLLNAVNSLSDIITSYKDEAVPVFDKHEIKEVYFMLMKDTIRPKVERNKNELVDVELTNLKVYDDGVHRSINWALIYDAARSRKFIEGLISKYKPQDMDELLSLFDLTKLGETY